MLTVTSRVRATPYTLIMNVAHQSRNVVHGHLLNLGVSVLSIKASILNFAW